MRLNQYVLMDQTAGAAGTGASAPAPAAGASVAGAPAPTGAGAAPAAAAPALPETYTFAAVKTTVDGKEVSQAIEPALVAEVSAFAKANGLTQAQAQAYMDREVKLAQDAAVADKEAQAKGLAALKAKWQGEARADAEFGGAAFDANLAVTQVALKKFFPEIMADANSHPFLDHPLVLKGLLKIGKSISPDGEFVGGKSGNSQIPTANILYPSMAK